MSPLPSVAAWDSDSVDVVLLGAGQCRREQQLPWGSGWGWRQHSEVRTLRMGMPQALLRKDKGVLGHLWAGRGQDAAGPEPLWPCSSQAEISAPPLPVGSFWNRAAHGRCCCPWSVPQILGLGLFSEPAGISFSIPATSTAAFLFIFSLVS